MKDDFAIRLMRMKKQKGINNADLTKLTGMSRGMICNLESGKVMPAGRTVIRLCNVLECSADYLLCLSDNPERK